METFRQEFGTSPSEYLKRRQIEAAVLLLIKTDLPLARVGYATGLGSQRTLFREFQRRLGTTPARVRSEREHVSKSKSGR